MRDREFDTPPIDRRSAAEDDRSPAASDEPPTSRERRLLIALGGIGILIVLTLGGFTLLYEPGEPEGLRLVIPEGAAATLDYPTIDSAIEVPTDLVLGRGDVLTITNEDTAANRAGPWVLAAGETLRMRFDTPGEYFYLCAVDEEESVTVTVVESRD